MKVRELISKVIECTPATTLSEAAAEMVERGIGALVVMDQASMVGILSERDVLRAAAGGNDLATVAAAEWMTTDVGSVDADTEVTEAAAWILAAGYRHLPVTDMLGDVIGILSIKDLLWAVVDSADVLGT